MPETPYQSDEGYFRWMLEASYGEWITAEGGECASSLTASYYNTIANLLAELPNRGPLLDTGCGLGRITFEADAQGFDSVGIDNARAFVEFCIQLGRTDSLPVALPAIGQDTHPGRLTIPQFVRRASPKFAVADALSLPFRSGTFGSAVCASVLDRVEQPRQAAAELARVVRPKGRLLAVSPMDWRRAFTPDVSEWATQLQNVLHPSEWVVCQHCDDIEYRIRVSDRLIEIHRCEALIAERLS